MRTLQMKFSVRAQKEQTSYLVFSTEKGFRRNPMATLVVAPASRLPVFVSEGRTEACVETLRDCFRTAVK